MTQTQTFTAGNQCRLCPTCKVPQQLVTGWPDHFLHIVETDADGMITLGTTEHGDQDWPHGPMTEVGSK